MTRFSGTNGGTEEAGASLLFTLPSENLISKVGPGRAQAGEASRAGRCGGAAETAPGGSRSPGGARRTSLGAGQEAGPGLVVERLVIHHGGRGGQCPFLSSAGAGAGSQVPRLTGTAVVHGPYLRGEAGPRGGARGM